jgi:hypothetical protein
MSGPTSGYRGDTITITASASDPDSDPLTYEWKIDTVPFPSQTDETFTFTISSDPSSVGTHTIYVRAKDDLGLYSDWKSMAFTTLNHPPTISGISGDTSGYRGTTMYMTALASDPEGDSLTYEWKIDSYLFPGQTDALFDEYIDYSPGNVGPHTVYVRAKDEIGDYSDWASKAFSTLNHVPSISSISGDTSGYRDVSYSWSATGSDVEGDSITYEWYLDGTLRVWWFKFKLHV